MSKNNQVSKKEHCIECPNCGEPVSVEQAIATCKADEIKFLEAINKKFIRINGRKDVDILKRLQRLKDNNHP